MYGALFKNPDPNYSRGYDNPSPDNVAWRLKVAIDRDNRLTDEEKRVYDRTAAELEFGPGFWRRAHP